MENASKALIIAGAILISIVLITLGVVILGQGQEIVNSSSMDNRKIATFNQQFTQYEGTSVSGANVNSLINEVISSNAIANRDGEANKLITIVPGNSGVVVVNHTTKGYTTKVTTKAQSGQTYTVTCVPDETTGYIKTINLSK